MFVAPATLCCGPRALTDQHSRVKRSIKLRSKRAKGKHRSRGAPEHHPGRPFDGLGHHLRDVGASTWAPASQAHDSLNKCPQLLCTVLDAAGAAAAPGHMPVRPHEDCTCF